VLSACKTHTPRLFPQCTVDLPVLGIQAAVRTSDAGQQIQYGHGADRRSGRPPIPEDAWLEMYDILVNNDVERPKLNRNGTLAVPPEYPTSHSPSCVCANHFARSRVLPQEAPRVGLRRLRPAARQQRQARQAHRLDGTQAGGRIGATLRRCYVEADVTAT
jgi:hypothetical protein